MSPRRPMAVRQQGIALVTSLLLLIIVTILALSLFRSFGSLERIAGNMREKERALHAAEAAQQYGEWWLLQPANIAGGPIACVPGTLNGTLGQGQICNAAPVNVSALPWVTVTTYLPAGMSVTPGVNGANGDPPYAQAPGIYIADLGPAADGLGEAYQVDAYGYGGSTTSAAVVESTYEIQQGVVNRGGL